MRATPPHPVALRRVLTLWPLVFYGLSVIVGAGVYVAIGAVIARAGSAAPLSFLLAGLSAATTGLCYAELAARFPEASGAVAYVRHGFGSDRLALLTGVALTIAVAIAAASIARGAVHYLAVLLPLHPALWTLLLVGGFTVVAAAGVRESVWLAAILGIAEIGALLVAIGAGFAAAPSYDLRLLVPADGSQWQGVIAGAFIAFFAFIGFETLANLAEEVKDAERTVPRGIMLSIAVSTLLYIAVAAAVALADRGGAHPLLGLFEGGGASLFAAIGGVAIANGVLVEIVLLARLFYGTAQSGQLPAILARIHPRTQTPLVATFLAGAIVLAAATLISFENLLILTDAITLGVFTLVDLALWRVQRAEDAVAAARRVPRWLPPAASALSFALMWAEFVI